jgi:spoIIIJ-associated protein
MNNDVRRKNRQQKEAPKAAAQPAPEASPAAAVQTAAAPVESGSGSSRRRSGRKPQTIQKAVNEDLASRYDIAESDEDYAKLDQLVAETEAAPAEKAEPAPAEPAAPVEDRRREAITREEMDYALEFANTLLKNMQLDARAVPAECPEGEDFIVTETADVYPKIDIIGSETGILIGHHGETLDSIQYLVNLSALRKTKSRDGDYVKIVVDIENYRQKREDTLRSLARRMAARAVRYRRNVFLEPMNAYERRIIHSELQSYPGVSTHSVGSDKNRKIVISYEGK